MLNVTVLELLKQKLPPDYVLAIIENMEEKVMLEEESSGSILSELEDLFSWSESYQGYEFWSDVFKSIRDGKKLPRLPFKAKWKPNTYVCLENGSFLINADGSGRDFYVELDVTKKPKEYVAAYLREQHLAFSN